MTPLFCAKIDIGVTVNIADLWEPECQIAIQCIDGALLTRGLQIRLPERHLSRKSTVSRRFRYLYTMMTNPEYENQTRDHQQTDAKPLNWL
jgi:hypothetical protein